jgi:hypothetical protein
MRRVRREGARRVPRRARFRGGAAAQWLLVRSPLASLACATAGKTIQEAALFDAAGSGPPGHRRQQAELDAILPVFADRDPKTITPSDVMEWIGGLQLSPGSVRIYLTVLRSVLDFAGRTGADNPARDTRVKPPRAKHEIVDRPPRRSPPSSTPSPPAGSCPSAY